MKSEEQLNDEIIDEAYSQLSDDFENCNDNDELIEFDRKIQHFIANKARQQQFLLDGEKAGNALKKLDLNPGHDVMEFDELVEWVFQQGYKQGRKEIIQELEDLGILKGYNQNEARK